MLSPISPEDILDYFEHHLSQDPFHALHWPRGAEVTRLWISLMHAGDALDRDDLKRLFFIISQPLGIGSGWHDVSLRVQHWLTTLPPLFQAEAMTAYFAGVQQHKPEDPSWQRGQQIAAAWEDLLHQEHVPIPVLDAFVTDTQHKCLFSLSPMRYLFGSMIDTWLESRHPTTTLRIVPAALRK